MRVPCSAVVVVLSLCAAACVDGDGSPSAGGSDRDDDDVQAAEAAGDVAGAGEVAPEPEELPEPPPLRDGGLAFRASCDTRDSARDVLRGTCRDWYSNTSGPNLAGSCSNIGGEYSYTMACPMEGRLGRCELDAVVGVIAVYNYYDSDWDGGTAEERCDDPDGETWHPEPR